MDVLIIKGGMVFQEDKTFAKKDICINNGRIVEIEDSDRVEFMREFAGPLFDDCVFLKYENDAEMIDASGLYVLPGLIDIHSHGAVGHDFSDGNLEGLQEILEYQLAHGITSYCPTSITLPGEKLLEVYEMAKACNNAKTYETVRSDSGAENREIKRNRSGAGICEPTEIHNIAEVIKFAHVPGFNMEGPFLDPVKKGAHKVEDIMVPNVDFFCKCNEACGNRIRLVTVAPNVEGALEFIKEICEENKNITISLGHTSADYDTAKAAFDAGAGHVTHLFNAMAPMNHREPGLVGAAIENDNCMVELICDGVHVHESMVRVAFKLFQDRVVLISDSMRAAGLGDGSYELGGQQVEVAGNLAKLKDGTIAGSVTNLFDCMRKAIEFGIEPAAAVAAASMNPAKSIGIFEEVGSISVGKRADILLVDEDFDLIKVIKA